MSNYSVPWYVKREDHIHVANVEYSILRTFPLEMSVASIVSERHQDLLMLIVKDDYRG